MRKLNETEVSKVIRFLDDEQMANTVKSVLLDSFLKSKPNRDIYQLAASRLSIDFLEDAWKDLEKSRNGSESEEGVKVQVGL